MHELIRFGVSLEKDLSEKFDALIKRRDWRNRSEAFRKLIRQELVKEEWQEDREIAGAIILVYNHHKRELVNRLTDIQHDFKDLIIASQHIHLDKNNCLEMIALKGRPKETQKLLYILEATKGVKHTSLSMSTTGIKIP